MKNISTKAKIIMIVILFIVTLSLYMVINAFYLAPVSFKLNTNYLKSSKISEDLNDVSILFFSDLEYGDFTNETRITKLVNKINSFAPDIVIFGGDLYDLSYQVSSQSEDILVSLLSQIKAPLGKFYVLGDFDLKNEAVVNDVLYRSDFEFVNNQIINIHNSTNNYFQLVGLNYNITKSEISDIYKNSQSNIYTITFTHSGDVAKLLSSTQTDLLLAGHTHGYQISIPFIGAYQKYENSSYSPGQKIINNIPVYITSGVGTINYDVRLFSDSEVVIYRLENK